ncbi:hypothetical protein LMIY3S_00779 [Labrys miyagiensis]
MSDPATIAKTYIATWNEADPARRQALLAATWTEDAVYVDPLMRGEGPEQIDGLIAAVQQRFPDFRFALVGEADGYGDHVRFSWQLGPNGGEAPIKGTDFVQLEYGRLRRVSGFLDQIPAAA